MIKNVIVDEMLTKKVNTLYILDFMAPILGERRSSKSIRSIQPNLTKFLQISVNKTNLTDFICTYFEENRHQLPDDQIIILSGGYLDLNVTKTIAKYNCVIEEELSNRHEEAYTRIIHLLIKLYLSYEVIL